MSRGKRTDVVRCSCMLCKKETSNVGLITHLLRAHDKDDRFAASGHTNGNPGNVSWNKGLTKETNDIVARGSAATSNTLKGKPGRPHTDATKAVISIRRKAFLEKNPSRVPYLLNHSSKRSYPEQYFSDCFAGLSNVTAEHHVFRYSLDFANIDEKLYLEIDGEQHYLDERIVAHDVNRTQKLLDMGWTGIRVCWSHFQKLSQAEKEE